MKCRVCRGPAVIDIRRHNANFCGEHFVRYCRQQVERAISDHKMLAEGDSVLVAVSGGKDSLAVWEILVDLGYEADGLYVGLGIGEYSDVSLDHVRRFATERSLTLTEIDLVERYGYDIPTAAAKTRRVPCSTCGISKRHVFDQATVEGGYDCLVTGHNLDDEVAVLYGNVMRWQVEYLGRQRPVLPAGRGFPRKVKPLVKLSERETAAYCVLQGIDYMVEECPMAAGNKHLGYKDALNELERQSPGTKANFYAGFLKQVVHLFEHDDESIDSALGHCSRCGAPAGGEICAFCHLVERAGSARSESEGGEQPVSVAAGPVPVTFSGTQAQR